MLFNSHIFIFIFLPITLAGFFLIGGRFSHKAAVLWLVACSLFFYGWWNPVYLFLILASIVTNYLVGRRLVEWADQGKPVAHRRALLTVGVVFNLSLLGYYKYANFFVNNLNHALGSDYHLERIILPLAISFFTFQQIAYLVDTYKGKTVDYGFYRYCLFVTFFPQLIAGPIVKHDETLPQFAREETFRFNPGSLSVGLTIFFIGLFKKVYIADGVAAFSTPVFSHAAQGVAVSFWEAWGGALCYTFQLYFDFSGYSDMAIGLGNMIGVKLPMNFNSPYKATSIIDFWRRWHVTLSRFLRDYLYIQLGGNRKGKPRRYINLMITMLLGGLWHGAGWTFVIWGGLHGLFLVINNGWRELAGKLDRERGRSTWLGRELSWALTFFCVVVAWVIFRADDLDAATLMLKAMSGFHGFATPESLSGGAGFADRFNPMIFKGAGLKWIAVLLLTVRFLPNTQEIMRNYQPVIGQEQDQPAGLGKFVAWKPSGGWAFIIACLALLALLNLSRASEFLYFQF